MRFLVKIQMPIEAGNKAAREGFKMIPSILAEQKPEAAYFYAEGGMRTCMMVVNMNDASEIPKLAEPWFQSLNASLHAYPAMVAEDLQKAEGDVKAAVEKYG